MPFRRTVAFQALPLDLVPLPAPVALQRVKVLGLVGVVAVPRASMDSEVPPLTS